MQRSKRKCRLSSSLLYHLCVRIADSLFTIEGLQEYQITRMEEEDSLDVTLIRSVGWLSRDDLRTRGGGAGPNMETPDAQCIGTYTFRAAFEFHPHKSIGHVATEAHLFRVPPRIYPGEAKGIGRLVEIDNGDVQWSSLRRVADGVELRVWNPTEQEQVFSLISRGKSVEQVDFLHEPVRVGEERLKPKEIATYLIKGGNKHE